jgi:DNA-binding NtrC family response regulator
MISAYGTIDEAVKAMQLGAVDFLTKPFSPDELRLKVKKIWQKFLNEKKIQNLIEQTKLLNEELFTGYEEIIGNSKEIKNVFSIIEQVANSESSILIQGESGTGKELVARAIHKKSTRCENAFIKINCGALNDNLLESELFGHEKGSFTGAITRRIGKFEEAGDGTIFLDEIGEMDISLQAKLLRVIQERELARIGGNAVIQVNARIIIATHKDLAREVREGRFREDLYYRLLGLPIRIPPLRERDNDILILAKHFLDNFCRENDMPVKSLSKDARDKLTKYSYPGNVRELKSVLELAAVMSNYDIIDANDINFSSVGSEDAIMANELTLKEYTFRIVKHFLKKYQNDVLQVAEKLDVGKSTIYRYIKEMEENNNQDE